MSNFKQMMIETGFKHSLDVKGLVPILKNNKILVYKVTCKNDLRKLSNEFENSLFDSYSVIVENNQKFKENLYNGSNKNIVDYRESTKEELWKKFELDDEEKRELFILKNSNEVEVKIPINEEIYTKGYRKENLDEILDRLTKKYITCFYIKPSKLSKITHFLSLNCYTSVEKYAELVYEFLYDDKKSFTTNTGSRIPTQYWDIISSRFTDKEKNISEEDKFSIIRDIINLLDIECVYSKDVDDITEFEIENIFNTITKKFIIDYAASNYDILYNSEFKDIYEKIKSSKSKIKR